MQSEAQADRPFTRWASRETFRDAVFLCSTPLVAARINSGCAALSAASAAALSPEASASSTLRTKVRTRERRILLTAARRAILRAAFLAEEVLAINASLYIPVGQRRCLTHGAKTNAAATRPPR